VIEKFKKIQNEMEILITAVHEKSPHEEAATPQQPAGEQVTNCGASQAQFDTLLIKLDLVLEAMRTRAPAPAYTPHGIALQHLPHTTFPMPLGPVPGLAAQGTTGCGTSNSQVPQEAGTDFLEGALDLMLGQQQSTRGAQDMLGSLTDAHQRRPQLPVRPPASASSPPQVPQHRPLADITNADTFPALHQNNDTELLVGMPPSRKVCVLYALCVCV
jgi:hypothetical protein